jgi:hypothetical protein
LGECNNVCQVGSLKKQLSKEEHISKPSTVYNTTFRKKDTWRRICNTNCERIANIERGLKKMAEMDMKVMFTCFNTAYYLAVSERP